MLKYICTLTAILFTLFPLSAQADHAHMIESGKIPEICEIKGTIVNMEAVQRSPWKKGTPSNFSVLEVHVDIKISERVLHEESQTPETTTCHTDDIKGKQVRYKLCSPTDIKPGDYIHATEGKFVVNSFGLGCLFDVSVLPNP